MLASFAGLATLVFIGVAATVGIRLLLLARQTRGLPEFVLGFGLFSIVAVGYPLALFGTAWLPSAPELGRWMLIASAPFVCFGWWGVWLFTWSVFRRDSPVARVVLFLALATLAGFAIASMIRTYRMPDASDIDYTHWVYLGSSFVAMTANVWGGIESISYYVKMRKRLSVGLGDPIVANRFLLYAIVMGSTFCSTGSTVLGSLLLGSASVGSPWVLVTAAVTGIVCSVALWLAFVPPRAYLARIRTAAA